MKTNPDTSIFRYFDISILLLLMLTSCINNSTPDGNSLGVGDQLPQFSVTMNNGEVVSDQSLKGQKALIVFFHTACSDCQKELPVTEEIYRKDIVKVVCISREQDEASVAAYWNDNDFTMPYSAQSTRDVYALFAVSHIPQIYIVSPQGQITHHWTDAAMPSAEDIIEALN